MKKIHSLTAAAVLLAALSAGCRTVDSETGSGTAHRIPLPIPTEHVLDEDAESEQRVARLRWIEEMHRTAPEVDWRAIERRNQDSERLRRNAAAATSMLSVPAWEEIGSRNQAGHTRCAAYGPERDGVRNLYVGSALGGVWRGTMDGEGWEPLSDHLYGGIDDVVVITPDDLADPDILVVRQGARVYRSDDEGATWELSTLLGDVSTIRAVAKLDDADQTIVLLVSHEVSFQDKLGIYASTDQGQTFVSRWTSASNGDSDMWVPQVGPAAANTIYIVHRGRLRVSTDSGATFSLVSEIDASATAGRLSGSEAGSPHFYAALQIAGQWQLFQSTDGGASFSYRSDMSDFWGEMTAFSSDPQRVLYGGVECWRSSNGGAGFTRINTWGSYYGDPANKLHADIRGIRVYPDPDQVGSADFCYINSDGGTYVTSDFGVTVQNLSLEGLGVGQFYTTHTSVTDPNLIVGGTQDQGYQRGFRESAQPGGGPSTPFEQIISGDYGHLTSGDGTHRRLYSTYPGFILIQKYQNNPQLVFEDFPVGASNLWLPPVVADLDNRETFYFLGDKLWRYDQTAPANWDYVEHSTQNFASGGSSYLSAMAFAPTDHDRAYAVTNNGNFWYSTDHAVTWQPASNSGPDSHYFYGNGLAVHPLNPLEAVAGGSGYSTAGVRRTQDGGASWQALDQGLPSTLVYGLAYAGDGTGDLFAATEAGAYRWRDADGQWSNIMGVSAPSTLYWSVEAVPAHRRIRFGTYGRGIWDYKIPVDGNRPLPPRDRMDPQ